MWLRKVYRELLWLLVFDVEAETYKAQWGQQ